MISLVGAIKNTVSISLFNKGQAGQIFKDIKTSGPKIVVKNNMPEAIIMSPDDYVMFMEEIEDARMILEASKRIENLNPSELISHKDILKKLAITEEELIESDEVEIE